MSRFLTYGYTLAIIGGLLLASGSALQTATTNGQTFSAQVLTTAFALSATLRLLGAIAMTIGFTALYVRASDPAGRFGLFAFTLVVANMIAQAAWMWSDLFLTSALAQNSPGVLDGTIDSPRIGVGMLTAWLLNTSIALLGIALLRARVFPRTVGIALLVAGAITALPLPFDGPMYEVIIGLAVLTAGVAARRSQTAGRAAVPIVNPVPAWAEVNGDSTRS